MNDQNEMSVDEFNRLKEKGKIRISPAGKIEADSSLFDDKMILDTISDENRRLEAERSLKVQRDVNKGTAIFIPGNVPSSKNQYEIIVLPGKVTKCCKAPYQNIGKGKVVCEQCGKVTTRLPFYSLGPRKIIRDYKKVTAANWQAYRNLFMELTVGMPRPLFVGFYFIRNSKRIFDYINAAQIVQDIMAKGIHNSNKKQLSEPWIPDDDADNIKPVFLGYHVEPNRPGVIIKVLPAEFNKLLNNYL